MVDGTRPGLLQGARGAIVGVSSERSIGYACALAARALGAEVAITYRPARASDGARLAAQLGATVHAPLEADDPSTIEEAFSAFDQAFGRLDFLVHTLMSVPSELLELPLTELGRDDFARVLDVGVYSLLQLCRQARPLLARSAAPRIVTISSPCSRRMTPHYHVAGIAKAALESALLYLAQELGPAGILCNAVSPALLATDGALAVVGAGAAASTRAHLAKRAPTRRPIELEDVADCVAWLCSPLARQITGEVITLDGGYSRSYF
jgi:enoyl-[acyl-carrier protein] reductase I